MIGIGPAQTFSRTVTIDAGTNAGLRPDLLLTGHGFPLAHPAQALDELVREFSERGTPPRGYYLQHPVPVEALRPAGGGPATPRGTEPGPILGELQTIDSAVDPSTGTIKLKAIFPNEDSIVRLIGAVLLEANDEWQLQHRYMQIEGMAELDAPAEANQSLIAEADAA